MTDKRQDQSVIERGGSTALVISETLRSADAAGRATDVPPHQPKKAEEEGMSVFWRVFGGTILSIAALAAITLYNSVASGIAELRAEVSRMNEAKGDFAKKDDLTAIKVQATAFTGYRAEIDALRERANKYRSELEDAKKDLRGNIDAVKKEEGLITDALRKDLAALEVMKERVALLTLDLKTARDDLQKVRGEVDKNQSADNARRDRRDAQYKQFDETLKELAKTLQETREKVARLEGQQGPAKPAGADPVTPPKSGTPN